jgi:uncharacterized RDD family membrane protein YckC
VQAPSRPQPGAAPENAALNQPVPLQLASLRLRLMSLAYEVILLVAILFLFSYLFLSLARDAQSGLPRIIFQIYLLSVCGVYFVFCWTRGGQTLPMKTWHMQLVTETGKTLSAGRAFRRYLFAIPGMLSGISLLWAPFDRERQFLHDRLARTRLVRVPSEQLTVNSER